MKFLPESPLQILLSVVLAIYIFLGAPVNLTMARLLDNLIGLTIILNIVLTLVIKTPVLLGALGVIAGWYMYRSLKNKSGGNSMDQYYPTREHKWSPFTVTNQFPNTLEEEEVRRMTSFPFGGFDASANWTPMSGETHGAMIVSK